MEKDWVDRLADILMWGGWTAYMLWAIAKALGWINTPSWLLALPYLVSGLAISGILVHLGKYLERFNTLMDDVKQLKKDVKKNINRIIKIESKVF